jgi:aspartate/methionine/tyrosine aminotransferase
VHPFIAMEVMREATQLQRAGADILHLEVGQPSTPAPRGVLDAAARALATDNNGYTDALGLPELREAIAGWYRTRYGAAVAPERVVITTGSSGAFILTFLAAFHPGERVALAAPGYPAYRNLLRALEIEPVELPTGPETRFQPTPALLEPLAGRIQGLIVASPSNPTGTMLEKGELAAIAAWCGRNGVTLISDEIYHGLNYGQVEPATAAALGSEVVVVNSFSKYFCMTGWRLGWAVVPDSLVKPMERLGQNLYISPPTLSQRAALAAFDCIEELDGHVARYARNRAVLLDGLPKAGITRFAPPDGAFYLYADVSDLSDDSADFCRRLLTETGVAITPGIDFDQQRGHRYVRMSFAGAEASIQEAVRRMIAWRRGA